MFDFVGMMGMPLVPCHEFPADAPALFLSVHALKDPDLASKLAAYVATGRPVLLTDGLASHDGRRAPAKSSAAPLPAENCGCIRRPGSPIRGPGSP